MATGNPTAKDSLIGILKISARYLEQLTPFDAKLARHQLAIPMRRHRSGV